jgi:hypothetical protein
MKTNKTKHYTLVSGLLALFSGSCLVGTAALVACNRPKKIPTLVGVIYNLAVAVVSFSYGVRKLISYGSMPEEECFECEGECQCE